MPAEPRDRAQRAPAVPRVLVAGLIVAGLTALVVTVPSAGARSAGLRASAPEPEASGTPTGAPPTVVVTEEPTPTAPPSGGEPTEWPATDPPTPSPPAQTPSPWPPATQPSQPGPGVPGQRPRLGVRVGTGDIVLDRRYWSRRHTDVALRVTVANTGSTAERITMRYTLPPGVADAGTPGCRPTGGRTYACGSWLAGEGARWAASIKLRVAGDAWERMPLSGSVEVTAVAPGRDDLGAVTDNQGFAVLFPPGPPMAGIALDASEVSFGAAAGTAPLRVALTNSGESPASGVVEVLLPEGVTVSGQPPGCAPAGGRTRCDLGRVAAGQTVATTLSLAASLETQRLAPLSGAVVGVLTSAGGRTKRMQMSFRINAAAASTTAAPATGGTAAPTGSQGVIGGFAPAAATPRGLDGVQKTAVALVVVSVLLIILALTLATTSLRRRMEDDSAVAD